MICRPWHGVMTAFPVLEARVDRPIATTRSLRRLGLITHIHTARLPWLRHTVASPSCLPPLEAECRMPLRPVVIHTGTLRSRPRVEEATFATHTSSGTRVDRPNMAAMLIVGPICLLDLFPLCPFQATRPIHMIVRCVVLQLCPAQRVLPTAYRDPRAAYPYPPEYMQQPYYAPPPADFYGGPTSAPLPFPYEQRQGFYGASPRGQPSYLPRPRSPTNGGRPRFVYRDPV